MSLFIWGVIGPVGLILDWAFVFVFIVMDNKEPEQSLAWLVLLFMLPGIGGLLYFFVGRDWRAPMNSKWRQGEEFTQPAMKPVYAEYKPLADGLVESSRGTIIPEVVSAIAKQNFANPLPVKTYKLLPHGLLFFRRCLRTCATPSTSSTTCTSSGSKTS